jgi:KDO2-lipid IV(A) lauroyltransferase
MLGQIVFYIFKFHFLPVFWFFPRKTAFWLLWQLSKIAGILVYLSPLRKNINKNLQRIYQPPTDQESAKLTKDFIFKMLRYIYEIINSERLNKKIAAKITQLIGQENLTNALEQKKGFILLVMHEGNWEWLACSLALLGYPITAIVNSPENSFFYKFLDKTRKKLGVELINIRTENMYLATLKALKKNRIVVMAVDTGATDSDKNIELKFLDHTLPIASGWATLALRTNTPIIAGFSYTENKEYTYNYTFSEIIKPEEFNTEKELLQKTLNIYETYIRRYPTEWFLPLSDSEVKKSFK